MLYQKIALENESADVFLECYVAEKVGDYVRNAILVIPGGGYGGVCADREGEPIALAFLAQGYNAFVLHYSVGRKKVFPAQLIEASKAMKYIRDHAQEYNINPEKVFVTGFSAGGHLAASLGTMWHREDVREALGDAPYGCNRPTGMMLIYPVISGDRGFGHYDSFANLLGKDMLSDEELASCSIEKHVDKRSVPAFVVHTANDEIVNVKNALALANAYADAEMQFEMHIYPNGKHGVALANKITRCGEATWDNPAIACWIANAAAWAENVV